MKDPGWAVPRTGLGTRGCSPDVCWDDEQLECGLEHSVEVGYHCNGAPVLVVGGW